MPAVPTVCFEPVLAAEAEALALLRVEALRESLERIGRFDAERARQRFLAGFRAEATRHVCADGRRIGLLNLSLFFSSCCKSTIHRLCMQ